MTPYRWGAAMFFKICWRHLVDFDSYLAAHWVFKGFPNRCVQEDVLEKHVSGIDFLMTKLKALRSKTKHFAVYLLQKNSFQGTMKYKES